MNKHIKKVILLFFIIILMVPAIERHLSFFNFTQLNGAYTNTSRIDLNVTNFLDDSYQIALEKNLTDSIGFKSILVRVYNQIAYSLFNISHANKVVVGTDDVLYEDYYINSYYGKDYIGHDKINEKVEKFSKLQQLLYSKGIHLLLAITPSKASIYPNNFPKHLKSEKGTTNYEKTIELLNKYDCKYIDLKNIFLELDKTTEYTLFPKQGIHWSGYGITKAADTLFKYLSNKTGIIFNNIIIKEGELTNIYQGSDNDIGDALNLLFKPVIDKLYYPEIIFYNDKNNTKPGVLIIGDSFSNGFWKFYPYFQNLFNEESQFWYYNQEIIWPQNNLNTKVESLDLYEEILKRKIILVISSEQNLDNLGYFFFDKTLEIFNNKNKFIKNKINHYTSKIKTDKNWLNSIKEKAKMNNISEDEMINIDVKWLCEQDIIRYYTDSINNDSVWKSNIIRKSVEKQMSLDSIIFLDAKYLFKINYEDLLNNSNTDKLVLKTIEKIKADIDWYNDIKQKAKKNNITVEEQLRIDAEWVVENM